MKGFVFFTLIGVVYYFFNSRYKQPIINHIYVYGFIFIGYLLIYLMNNQKEFMYKIANNLNNTNKFPVHSLIPDFKIDKENNNISY